jgi:hypothetical protein
MASSTRPTPVLDLRELRLRLGQLLLRVEHGLMGVDSGLRPGLGLVPRVLEVGARVTDVTDGRGGLGEYVAVPVQRLDVGLARSAERLRLLREVGLRVRESLLLRLDLGLGRVEIGRCLAAAVAAHQTGQHQGPGDDDAEHPHGEVLPTAGPWRPGGVPRGR